MKNPSKLFNFACTWLTRQRQRGWKNVPVKLNESVALLHINALCCFFVEYRVWSCRSFCLIAQTNSFARAGAAAPHVRPRTAPLIVAAKINISSRVRRKAAAAGETLHSLCPVVWRMRYGESTKLKSIRSNRQGQVGSTKGRPLKGSSAATPTTVL